MKFLRRLRYYLFGFLIGCGFVVFFFQGRLSVLTSWLPGNRVLELLTLSEAHYSSEALCRLECFHLDTADVSLAKSEGDVRFKLSTTDTIPKLYVVDSESDERKVRMTFATADSIATLVDVSLPEEVVNCPCGE